GKSLQNYIGINEPPYDMFAKVMKIPDNLLRDWFELLTDRPTEELDRLLAGHPMAAKQTLGRDIVTCYHGSQAAEEAAAEWRRRFSERQDPTEIPEAAIPSSELQDGKIALYKLLVLASLAKTNNEARRLVQGGGVTIGPEREKLTDPAANIT